MELGEVIILRFGQGFWFGNRIKKTLINPNKYQYFVIPIYDDPTDQHRLLGIEEYFNTHIPMLVVGFTCGFITWYPTYDGIETCRHINVSNGHD